MSTQLSRTAYRTMPLGSGNRCGIDEPIGGQFTAVPPLTAAVLCTHVRKSALSGMEACRVVAKAPPKICYIPEFITKAEEKNLIKNVYEAPKPKWTQLSNRRLQNWGGIPHPKGMISEDLPQWLQLFTKRINDTGAFGEKTSNHVLVNEYLSGQGIMPHEDGPLFYPTVSTISLGSHTFLDFYYRLPNVELTETDYINEMRSTSLKDRYFLSLLLEPRSLILVQDDMYKTYLHGIEERTEDVINEHVANLHLCQMATLGETLKRTTRISLTVRHVLKVVKAKLLLCKR